MRKNINIKGVLIAGAVVNLVSFIVGGGSYHLFSWVFLLEPQDIWRWKPGELLTTMPMTWLIFLFLGNLVLAIMFALVYAILYQGIPGQGIKKGLVFGFLMWLIGVLVPIFSMYILLKIASGAIIYFTLEGLFEYLIYGVVISVIYKEKWYHSAGSVSHWISGSRPSAFRQTPSEFRYLRNRYTQTLQDMNENGKEV